MIPPTTYKQGSKAIDGICLSPELHLTRTGYLPIYPIGDHRPAYIDIPWDDLLRENIIRIEKPLV